MRKRIRLYIIFALMIAVIASSFTLSVSIVSAEKDALSATVVRLTPPAPAFDETKRLNELAARRKQVAETIGPKAMLVLFSAEPRVYANDVDYQFRQENNLFYLTNLNQKRGTLVLTPGNTATPEILFLPRRSPAAETWTGHMYSPQEAAQLSGIKEIWEASEFDSFIKANSKAERSESPLISSVRQWNRSTTN